MPTCGATKEDKLSTLGGSTVLGQPMLLKLPLKAPLIDMLLATRWQGVGRTVSGGGADRERHQNRGMGQAQGAILQLIDQGFGMHTGLVEVIESINNSINALVETLELNRGMRIILLDHCSKKRDVVQDQLEDSRASGILVAVVHGSSEVDDILGKSFLVSMVVTSKCCDDLGKHGDVNLKRVNTLGRQC